MIGAPQLCFLGFVGEKTALHQHGGTVCLFQKIDALAGFHAPMAVGVQGPDERSLQGSRQFLPGGVAEHLGSGILALGEIVLMDAQKQSVFRGVDQPDPLLQVRDLLLGKGLSGGVNGHVLLPQQRRVIAQQPEQVPQPQADLQIDLTFRYPRAGDGAPVLPAVAGVNDQLHPLHGAGGGKDPAPPENDCQQHPGAAGKNAEIPGQRSFHAITSAFLYAREQEKMHAPAAIGIV